MDNIAHLLKEGIQAIKSGQREQAKALLMQVIELDESNERAWLWLSGAVDTDEERLICLENVLTINPNNELAQKGLARLKPVVAEATEEQEEIDLPASFAEERAEDFIDEPISEVFLPPSLEARAAQIAKPKSEESAGWWVDKTLAEPVTSTAVKKFHDVWAGHEELCAFCAEPILRTQSRCPKCNRPLIVKAFINPVPSKYHGRLFIWMILQLVLYGVVAATAFIYFPQVLPDMDRPRLLAAAASASLPLIAITVGVYKRQPWSYWLLLIPALLQVLVVIRLLIIILTILSQIGANDLLFLIREEPTLLFLMILFTLFLLIVFLNAFIVYMAGEDFKQMPVRRIATVSERLKDPGLLDRIAQRLAKDGQWAAAVLHWQRAAGRASGHAPYLLRLGHAYAELGFYERSLDILNSALETARSSEIRQEVEQAMIHTKRLSERPDEPQAKLYRTD